MAEYPNFKHGTRGQVVAEVMANANKGRSNQAIVYIGTAPVHQVKNGAKNVNRPILVNNIAEARSYLGYSDNYADYTLCEAMHVHFELNGVGPLVFINVLDPAKHRDSTSGGATLTPENGRVKITNAEDVILDTLVVKSGTTTKVLDTDYTATYDSVKKVITLQEIAAGALGTASLTITWAKIDPSAVTQADVIGTTDGHGINTGMYVIEDVYNLTGYIPAFILAPGFSSIPAIHNAMYRNSQNIASHWNAWMFVDLPVIDANADAIDIAGAPTWKNANGYNKENESVFFPLVKGTDGKTYHISVLNAANFQALLIQNNGIPYMTGSNTECSIIENLYFSESVTGGVYTDAIINRALNANGINSAAYVGGRWVIWGMFAGSYNQEDGTAYNIFDTCMMMLYYLTNDFQHRQAVRSDKPLSANDLKSMAAEEQTRVDALLGIGALTYGKVAIDAKKMEKSDVYQGDYNILYDVSTMPLAKSLTATANLTEKGLELHYKSFVDNV